MFMGERLADLRKDRGLSQASLAAELGISQEKLSTYERGKHHPPDNIKIKIAIYFDITLDYLMGLTKEEVSYDRKDVITFPKGFPVRYSTTIKEMVTALIKQQRTGRK